jgi:hypothetical protein
LLLLLSTLACACTADSTSEAGCFDGKCDGQDTGACSDARYGDGVCQTDLSCAIPDIDCFETFTSDASAQQWFNTNIEIPLAAEESRAPRSYLPESDPRFIKVRALLDRGWEAFRANRPVGQLREARPALVMLDDPGINAFVAPDIQRQLSAFSVQVQTGLLTSNLSDEAMLGVMMHELQHAVGLHLIKDTKQTIKRYYVSPPGDERIGRVQPNNEGAQKLASEWLEASGQVGSFSTAALGGMPTSGELAQVFHQVVAQANQQNPAGCAHTLALYNQLSTDLTKSIDTLSGALLGDPNVILARTTEVLAAAQNECMASWQQDLIAVIAAMSNQSYEAVEQAMPPSDVALVKGQHVITGIANLTIDRRTRMRGDEAAFQQLTGSPWTSLRFFSHEEDADDVSVPVMRGAGLSPTSLADFLLGAGLLGEAEQPCRSMIAAAAVPAYGVDLTDAHHATCWRAYHIGAVAAWSNREAERAMAGTPVLPPSLYHLPLPARVADAIAY